MADQTPNNYANYCFLGVAVVWILIAIKRASDE